MIVRPCFDHLRLVDARGEIDRAYLVAEGRRRAEKDFGQPNPPASFVRPHINNLETIAALVRSDWRISRGLPDCQDSVGFQDLRRIRR